VTPVDLSFEISLSSARLSQNGSDPREHQFSKLLGTVAESEGPHCGSQTVLEAVMGG